MIDSMTQVVIMRFVAPTVDYCLRKSRYTFQAKIPPKPIELKNRKWKRLDNRFKKLPTNKVFTVVFDNHDFWNYPHYFFISFVVFFLVPT